MINGEPDKKMGFDHSTDSLGYTLAKLMPIRPVLLPPAFSVKKAG
jgi:hypothetical protein